MTSETPSAGGESIGTARIDVTVNTGTMQSGIDAAKRKVSGLGAEAEAQFDRATASTKRYADSLLRQANLIGKSRAEQIAYNAQTRIGGQLGEQIAKKALEQEAALKAATAAMKGASHGAHEFGLNNSFARRELGRLANDLVNGNYGRFQQTSLTLANATGLLGKAFTTTGLAVAGVGAVIAALAIAYYKGQLETEAYNKALITTGNYAGVTSVQLANMAKGISQSIGTQHEAAAALATVAASGKFTADQLELVARAAVDANRVMGQSTEATVQQFEKLKDDPVKALQALNDAQHFLTLSTYERIRALQDEGKEQEAATLAIKTYSDTLDERRKAVVDNLGFIERAWLAVKDATKGAVDAALDIGRDDVGAQIQALNKQLQDLLKGGGTSTNYVAGLAPTVAPPIGENDPRVQALRKQISDLYTKVENDAKAARDKAMQAQIGQDKADSDREVAEFATNAQKRATELAKVQGEYNARIARALAAGNTKLAADLRASEKLVLAGIEQKYKDPKQPKSPEASAYQTFKSQVDALDVKTISADDAALTAYQQGIRKLADELGVYISKGGDAAKAAAEFNRGQQALAKTMELARRQETDAERQYAAALQKTNQALADQVNNEIARIGMGEKEYQRTQQVSQAYREQAAALADLALKRQMGIDGRSGGISQGQYDADVQALNNATQEKVRILQDGYRRQDAAQADWLNGASKAYQDYVDQVANVAGQTDQLFTDAFGGMADALANFVTTGKLNFTSLAETIVADLAKMEARILASKILQGVLGSFLGSSDGNGEMATSFDSNGTFFSPYAKGGVFSGSPSLSAYSGQVVSKPTLFAFARGAGVMGEAGPEAIMPLRRGPDGRLGVAAAAGGPSELHITLKNESGQPLEAAQQGPPRMDGNKVFADFVIRTVTQDFARNGPASKTFAQRYGLRAPGVPVGG